jgi:hypothetical protein
MLNKLFKIGNQIGKTKRPYICNEDSHKTKYDYVIIDDNLVYSI